jgi:hypothetical protein
MPKNVSSRSEVHPKFSDQLIEALIGHVMLGIKMSVFSRRFQKYKLTLVTKWTYKELFPNNCFLAQKIG